LNQPQKLKRGEKKQNPRKQRKCRKETFCLQMRTCEVGFWEKERKNCTFEMRERKNRKKDVVRRKSPKREIQSLKENDSDTQRQTQSQVDIICLIFEILYTMSACLGFVLCV
jgi:hypothetical protein